MKIGEKLKSIRKNKGLTQAEFGNLVGLSEITIRRYEKGERTPTVEVISQISKALDIPTSDFFNEDDTIKSKANKRFYKNANDDEIISLLRPQGLKEDRYINLSKEEKIKILEKLSPINPLQLKLKSYIDNFENITKKDLVDFYNSMIDYIEVVMIELSEYFISTFEKDYEDFYKEYTTQKEYIEELEKLDSAKSELINQLFNLNKMNLPKKED